MTHLRKNDSTITSPLTAFGDLRVAELSPVFQVNFAYTVDNTHLSQIITVNGGGVTQADAMGVVSSSTTTASVSCLQSTRQATYRAGLGGLCRFTCLFESSAVGTGQYAGLVDEVGATEAFKNGYAFGYDGTTFGVHRFKNDTKITVAQENWDDPMDGTGASGMILDHTKLNVFQIQFQYLGAGAITYWLEGDSTGLFVKVYTELYANLNTTPSVYMPNFHIMLYVNNGATTSDLVIKTASMAYFIEGKTSHIELQQPQHTSDVQQKTSVTTQTAIFTIRNKTTYAGKNNFIEVLLENVSGSIESSGANNLAKIRMIRNATLGGTPSWSDIDPTDSVLEMDTSGTTVTGGEVLLATSLAGKNDRANQDLLPLSIILAPGESVTISGESANSATINSALLIRELF